MRLLKRCCLYAFDYTVNLLCREELSFLRKEASLPTPAMLDFEPFVCTNPEVAKQPLMDDRRGED